MDNRAEWENGLVRNLTVTEPEHGPQAALAVAVQKLADLKLHKIPMFPDPSDFRKLQDDLTAIWEIIDPLIEAIGQHARENSIAPFDLELFKCQLQSALEGNATYELETQAELLIEERMEAAE